MTVTSIFYYLLHSLTRMKCLKAGSGFPTLSICLAREEASFLDLSLFHGAQRSQFWTHVGILYSNVRNLSPQTHCALPNSVEMSVSLCSLRRGPPVAGVSALLSTLARGMETQGGGNSPVRPFDDDPFAGDALFSPPHGTKRPSHPSNPGASERSSERRKRRASNKSKMMELIQQVWQE